jgi:hypothetical protein
VDDAFVYLPDGSRLFFEHCKKILSENKRSALDEHPLG